MTDFIHTKINSKYHPLRVWLHWISAGVIIWALFSGFFAAYGTSSTTLKAAIGYINVSLTTLFLPVFALRIICAFTFSSPRESHAPLTLQKKIAKCMHFSLYLVISVVMITGVLMMERDINVFDLFSLPRPISDDHVAFRFKQIHILSCMALCVLVCGHVFAVFTHLIKGNKIMSRMSL